jgi:hypothetical protein
MLEFKKIHFRDAATRGEPIEREPEICTRTA